MESFNGKLRDELLDREIFYTLQEVKGLTEEYRRTYNHIRPAYWLRAIRALFAEVTDRRLRGL